MAEKRRDSKKRILKAGESQRKDGRYMYKYTDIDGKVRYEYSWKLVPTDRMPAGKKDEPSLREKIKEIEQRHQRGISNTGANMTVFELVERSMGMRKLKESTRRNYEKYMKLHLAGTELGNAKATQIKPSNAKAFIIDLQKKKGLAKGTARLIGAIIETAYGMALEDEMVTRNPFRFQYSTILVEDKKEKTALSTEQLDSFFRFVENDSQTKKHKDAFMLLFETGLRISEFAGLRVCDIDFVKREIKVDHQLGIDGKLTTTKSKAGERIIPMTNNAYGCLKRIVASRHHSNVIEFDAHDEGFLFAKKKNKKAILPRAWERRLQVACEKWIKKDPQNGRMFTPHICRHTFCTRLVMAGVNIKSVQYLMGHSSPQLILDIYAHVRPEDIRIDIESLI